MKHLKTIFALACMVALTCAMTFNTSTCAYAGSLFSLKTQDQCRPAPGQRVLVAGLSENPELRRLFEQTACENLKKQGIDAKASFSVMPASAEAPMDRRVFEEKARSQNMDFVLFTSLDGIYETRHISPYDPMLYYLGPGDTAGMLNAHQQQYVDQNADTWKHVKLHCRLYDVNAGKIVWSDRLDIARPAKAISVKGVVNRAADKIARTVSICKTTRG
jgi:hypothetical protein